MLKTFGLRLSRVIYHLFVFLPIEKPFFVLPYRNPLIWLGDLLFLIFDLLLMPEVYSLLIWLSGKPLRSMNTEEVNLAKPYLGDAVDYSKVRVHEQLGGFISKIAHAFVSFNIINYKTDLNFAIFLHELVHVWQYQTFGSPYIFRSLLAQKSKEGYNYGGVEGLFKRMNQEGKFIDLNFEQQGEVFEDAYKLQFSYRGQNSPMYKAVYDYFTNQVKV